MLNIIIFIITIYFSFFNNGSINKNDFIKKIVSRFNVEDVFLDKSINLISREKENWFNEIKIATYPYKYEEGDLVVCNDYLVGIITEISSKNTTVELITNSQKKLSVKIDNQYALIDSYEDGFLIIKMSKEPKLESKVVTSGINYIYPADILVGVIHKIEKNNNYYKVYVKTDVDFNNLNNLEIMKR